MTFGIVFLLLSGALFCVLAQTMQKRPKATPPPLNNMIYDANGLLFHRFLQGSLQSSLLGRLGPTLAPLMRSTPFVEIASTDTLQSFVEIATISEQHGKNNIAFLSVGTDAMAWYLGRRCGDMCLQTRQSQPGQCVGYRGLSTVMWLLVCLFCTCLTCGPLTVPR